ncbi:hypothetical protein GTZ97_12140 [Aquabacterium fontiphilum]|jgi:hypothetical protein|uniref:hypothetical protein n=1 Tax=Aquabacterium fontiphilum TaxID=450365 RepID=UPI001378D5B7|nr:hypothetical protein [Aquabacterium fontiphilum]NBD21414.1 hypothetical protein [Aquabacterium fontiphilum]
MTAPLQTVDACVARIEADLDALDHALAGTDPAAITQCSQALQQGLTEAVACIRQAAQRGQAPLAPQLQARLALAQTRVQQQWAAAHRATVSVDRVLGILLPREEADTYTGLAATPVNKALNAYR